MRDHGVDMPDPVFEGGGPGGGGTFSSVAVGPDGNAASQAADRACKPLLAGITFDGGGPSTMSPEEQQAFLNFSQCMRDHGIDMPDPQFSGGGVSVQIGNSSGGPANNSTGGGIDPTSPAFAEAQKACQHVLTDAGIKAPDGGATSGGGPGGGDSGGAGGKGTNGGQP
jgi:hypothetical protein